MSIGKHDDQVDALSMAVDVLSRQSVTPEQIFGGLDAGNSLNQEMTRKKDSLAGMLGSRIFRGWGE